MHMNLYTVLRYNNNAILRISSVGLIWMISETVTKWPSRHWWRNLHLQMNVTISKLQIVTSSWNSEIKLGYFYFRNRNNDKSKSKNSYLRVIFIGYKKKRKKVIVKNQCYESNLDIQNKNKHKYLQSYFIKFITHTSTKPRPLVIVVNSNDCTR